MEIDNFLAKGTVLESPYFIVCIFAVPAIAVIFVSWLFYVRCSI